MKELDNEKDKYVDGLMDRHRDKQIDKLGVQIHTSVDWGTPRRSRHSTRLGAPLGGQACDDAPDLCTRPNPYSALAGPRTHAPRFKLRTVMPG